MERADAVMAAFFGAILVIIGLAGMGAFIGDRAAGVIQHPVFDLSVPVFLILVGLWLFRVAKLQQPVSWPTGLGVLLVFLGLAAAALCVDQIQAGQKGAVVFGFILGGALVVGGIWLMRSRRARQET
jgi:hypothetical protein